MVIEMAQSFNMRLFCPSRTPRRRRAEYSDHPRPSPTVGTMMLGSTRLTVMRLEARPSRRTRVVDPPDAAE